MEPQYRFCTSTDGTRIAYAIWGYGPPLLFVQAWSASIAHHTSAWVREWVDRVAARRTFVIMDRRGTGASQRDVQDLSLEAQLADIDAVMDHVGSRKVDLFSVSDGAAICLAFAARRPDRVSRLVLWCPWAASEQIGGSSTLTAMAELMHRNARLGIRAYADLVLPSGMPGELRQYRQDIRKDTTAELWPLHFQFIAALDVRADLPKVQAPTLVLHRRGVLGVPLEAGRSVAAMVPNARLIVVEGDSAHQALGDQSYVDSVVRFLDEDRASVERPELLSGTAIILFADIADSTALTERLGDAAFREKARELDVALRRAIGEADGTAIEGKLLGDGVLATFSSAREAIKCASACHAAAASAGLTVHVGLNAGDVIREDNNVYGGAVNIAARVASEARADETLVSDIVRGLAKTSAGVSFEDRGEHMLKGIDEPVRLYEVRWREEA